MESKYLALKKSANLSASLKQTINSNVDTFIGYKQKEVILFLSLCIYSFLRRVRFTGKAL